MYCFKCECSLNLFPEIRDFSWWQTVFKTAVVCVYPVWAPWTWICPAFLSSLQSVAPLLLSEIKGFGSVLICISLFQYSQLIFQEFFSRLLRNSVFLESLERKLLWQRPSGCLSVEGWVRDLLVCFWPSWTWGNITCMSAHCSWNARMTQHGQVC